jgi:hypothetical protein
MELVHGGDWAGYRARFGHDALDFSANVSPLGLPQGVADAIAAALPTADRYPDPLCRELRTALSRAEQLPEPWILCGNGAADLIYRLVWALKPRRALLPAPTFAEYAAALESVGCEVKRKTLHETDDFAVTEAFVQAVNQPALAQPQQVVHGIFCTGQDHAVRRAKLAGGLHIAHAKQRVLLQRHKVRKVGNMRQPHNGSIQRLNGIFDLQPVGKRILVLNIRL